MNKFNKIINEYIVGTQNRITQSTATLMPPDSGMGLGQSKKHRKILARDRKLKKKYEKPIRKSI